MSALARGACVGLPSSVFFPDGAGATLSEARAVCASCPVQPECLDENINERWGFVGGMSDKERMAERKRRRNNTT